MRISRASASVPPAKEKSNTFWSTSPFTGTARRWLSTAAAVVCFRDTAGIEELSTLLMSWTALMGRTLMAPFFSAHAYDGSSATSTSRTVRRGTRENRVAAVTSSRGKLFSPWHRDVLSIAIGTSVARTRRTTAVAIPHGGSAVGSEKLATLTSAVELAAAYPTPPQHAAASVATNNSLILSSYTILAFLRTTSAPPRP